MTEQNIKEGFKAALSKRREMPENEKGDMALYLFREGYLAMLNSLEPTSIFGFDVYRLPEGVTKP